ncbi:MAG: DJ-1/PfpI family protein [Melioribacteraceae bacterium]|nr:DJ-1/PfpI family protein [Melioribacteraceae bacterium]MDD3558872.1 DJ-1/PfpI family protein [Melioribacteraceae bacterium]
MNTKKNILLFLAAKDFSDEEYLIVSKAFLRKGLNVFVVSDCNGICTGSNGLKVKNDVKLYNVHPTNFNAFVLVGGKGMRTYWNNSNLKEVINKFLQQDKILAAVCSAPVIFARMGLLMEKKATCYFEDKKELEKFGAVYADQDVVVSEKIITGQNPQAADRFTQTVINLL